MISSGLHTLNVASKHTGVTGKNSRYIDSNSLEFDGNDDYVDCTLASDIFNKEKGTISIWGIFDTRGNRTVFHAFRNADNNADFFRIQTQGVSGLSLDGLTGIDGLITQYVTTIGGSRVVNVCQAMNSSSFHGHGHTRKKNNYGAGDIDGTGTSGFGADHAAFRMTANMNGSTWHHIVFTWDTTETFTPTKPTTSVSYPTPSAITGAMRVYVNGDLKNHGQSTVASNNQIGPTGSFEQMTGSIDTIRLGLTATNGSDQDGHISNVAVWNSRLTDAEVLAIYNSGAPTDLRLNSGNYTSAPGLVGYWTMQEGTGSTIFDRSVNNNHLTIRNNTSFTTVTPT